MRLDVLSDNQRDFLITGHYFWDGFGQPRFEDEDHAREAWRAHRDEIMGSACHPGQRPVAFWKYDAGDWSRYGASEPDAVRALIKSGRLEPIHRNGGVPIASEIVQIETEWLHEIRCALGSGREVEDLTAPLPTWGCPPWFYREHAPRIQAELQAEHDRSRTLVAQEIA